MMGEMGIRRQKDGLSTIPGIYLYNDIDSYDRWYKLKVSVAIKIEPVRSLFLKVLCPE